MDLSDRLSLSKYTSGFDDFISTRQESMTRRLAPVRPYQALN